MTGTLDTVLLPEEVGPWPLWPQRAMIYKSQGCLHPARPCWSSYIIKWLWLVDASSHSNTRECQVDSSFISGTKITVVQLTFKYVKKSTSRPLECVLGCHMYTELGCGTWLKGLSDVKIKSYKSSMLAQTTQNPHSDLNLAEILISMIKRMHSMKYIVIEIRHISLPELVR